MIYWKVIEALLQPIRGLDEGLTSLITHYQGGQLNLNSAELIHLLGRFEHEHMRHGSCTMTCKEVSNLKEKILNEYYIKVQGRGRKT